MLSASCLQHPVIRLGARRNPGIELLKAGCWPPHLPPPPAHLALKKALGYYSHWHSRTPREHRQPQKGGTHELCATDRGQKF